MIQVSMLMRMDNQSARKSTNKCYSNNSMEMKWDLKVMVMKWWMIMLNNSIFNNNSQRKILSKIKFKRLSQFVLRMMHFSVIQNSQPMTHHCITIQLILQNIQWIWEQLNGKDHKKLFQKMRNQECIEMQWVQEILKWEFLETAGSWDLF